MIRLSRRAAQEIFEQEYAAPKELLHVAAGCYKYAAPLALWVCHATGDSRALGGNQSVANDRDLEDVLLTALLQQGGAPRREHRRRFGRLFFGDLKPLKRLGVFCRSQSPGWELFLFESLDEFREWRLLSLRSQSGVFAALRHRSPRPGGSR